MKKDQLRGRHLDHILGLGVDLDDPCAISRLALVSDMDGR